MGDGRVGIGLAIMAATFGLAVIPKRVVRLRVEQTEENGEHYMRYVFVMRNLTFSPVTMTRYRLTVDGAVRGWGDFNWEVGAPSLAARYPWGWVTPDYYGLAPGVHTSSVELMDPEGNLYQSETLEFEVS